MSLDNLANPVEAVGLISIYSYFNLLSDFLLSENYLPIDDRQKQIPVVNALYKYFDEHPDNLDPLIRSLLQGSDLYGEKIGETFDDIFVNSMFEYIISSLVFDKFGNIYGFLADVVRKTENLEIKNLFEEIKKSLEKTAFENEYGNDSLLTPLAAERIFNDIIIQPLFPQPKIVLNLLSLDYIYAQAGLIFLRPGIMNALYYSGMFDEKVELNNETLFDEYLLLGHLIEELIIEEKLEQFNITAFALPALFVYVANQNEKLEREKITNIIFDPEHWVKAYNYFFKYLDDIYSKIDSYLKVDTKYNLHFELTQFKTCITLARWLIDSDPFCKLKTEEEKMPFISRYLHQPKDFECKIGHPLPNLYNYYQNQINNIVEAYKKFEKRLILKVLTNYFQSWKRDTQVVTILVDYNSTSSVFEDKMKRSFDLFGIYFSNNGTTNYYALIRNNYNAKVVTTDDDPELFQQIHASTSTKLYKKKPISDQIDPTVDKIIKNRSYRLESLLLTTLFDPLKSDWWKEYGLSLVPLYPCLSGKILNGLYNEKDPCKIETFTLYPIDKEDDNISVNLIQVETRSLLKTIGTSIKTLSLKNLIRKIMKKEEMNDLRTFQEFLSYKRYSKLLKDQLKLNSYLLSSLSNDPWNNAAVKIENTFNILEENVRHLKIITSLDYTSIFNLINNIKRFLIEYHILSFDNNNNSTLELNMLTRHEHSYSGYGYAFVMLNDSEAAYLRTIDEYGSRKKVLLLLTRTISPNEKEFRLINESTLNETKKHFYEIDCKLQHSLQRLQFITTDIADYNLRECNFKTISKSLITNCRRIINREKQQIIENQVLNESLIQMPNVSRDDLLKVIKIYVFPDENFSVQEFLNTWKSEENFLIPQKGKKYIIEHKEELFKLRYKKWLEEENLNLTDVTKRIKKIYIPSERIIIEKRTILKDILENYEHAIERFTVTFEDYYAIRNFATTGYKKITSDTNEAKRMKIALYNLAIRQSDDPIENFDFVLTTIENMRNKSIKKLFLDQEEYTLQKFTITGRTLVNNKIPSRKKDFENVLLNIKFSKPYLRAKIKQKFCFVHPKSILLPGTKFLIEGKNFTNVAGVGQVWQINLKYVHEPNEKYLWYQKIMKSISLINL